MEKTSTTSVPSTTRFTVLGFTVEQYRDPCNRRDPGRWELSIPGRFILSLASVGEAIALAWRMRIESAGGAL